MTGNLFFLALLLCTLSCIRGDPLRYGNTIFQWENVFDGAHFAIRYQAPAGAEEGVHLFTCRAKQGDRWNPGKLWMHGGYYCAVSSAGYEHKHTSFQVLETPLGTTSWEPVQIPLQSNAIPGGTHWDGTTAYMCRGKVEGHLIPGTLAAPNNCYVARAALEVLTTTDVEVLVVNAYGKIRGY